MRFSVVVEVKLHGSFVVVVVVVGLDGKYEDLPPRGSTLLSSHLKEAWLGRSLLFWARADQAPAPSGLFSPSAQE